MNRSKRPFCIPRAYVLLTNVTSLSSNSCDLLYKCSNCYRFAIYLNTNNFIISQVHICASKSSRMVRLAKLIHWLLTQYSFAYTKIDSSISHNNTRQVFITSKFKFLVNSNEIYKNWGKNNNINKKTLTDNNNNPFIMIALKNTN